MTLVDVEWIKSHRWDEIDGKTGMECIRCGQCCLHVPCYWAQLWYGLTKERNKCPDLKREEYGTYTCLMMGKSTLMKREMLGTGCHYPEWRSE